MPDAENNQTNIFEERPIRSVWHKDKDEWYFSVIDIIAVLTDSENPRRYWSDLKRKLASEGSQLYEKIVQLKIVAADGKMRSTDCLTTEQFFRLIQSIPSPKTESLKLWMAQIAKERLDKIRDPKVLKPSLLLIPSYVVNSSDS